jgi:Sulfotransferase family
VIDVIYVGGAGRSGSTVLALLLAQLPGFVAVGGVTNLWERGLQQNYRCGCGASFRSCPFWEQVGKEAFGGWHMVDPSHVLRMQSSAVRYRHWPAYLVPSVRHRILVDAPEYADHTRRVYAAIAGVAGASTVVDNSHDISPALLLGQTPGVRAHIVHLVRDSRGVAFSLAKYVARTEATGNPTYMPRYAPARASMEWLIANLPYHLAPRRSLPRLRVRYESLVVSPTSEIRRVVEFVGGNLSAADGSMFEAGSLELAENHMISGNPHRLGRRRIDLRLDDEWRTAMARRDRILTTLLTLPLTIPYGYVGARRIGAAPAKQPDRRVAEFR